MSIISKKICLVGDFGVGKTSLIRQFVERQFSDQYLSTVGVKISRKAIELENVKQLEKLTIQLLIWDLEGSTKFKAIAPSYLQGASGAVIVADLNRLDTIEHIPEHIQLFSKINAKGFVIVALNKADTLDEDKLSKMLSTYQFSNQDRVIGTYETSAKTGTHVEKIFEELTHKIIITG